MAEMIRNFLSLLRIKHWMKNTFVFLPVFFAGKIGLVFSTHVAFVFLSFCLAASSIYILNDIIDVEEDRNHPLKRFRPIASGFFSKNTAAIILAVLVLLFLASLTLIEHASWYVLGYFLLNILYSFALKKISIVDVSCISIGFVLRVIAGGEEAQVFVSNWMIIMVFLLTISLAFAKRRDDLVIDVQKDALRKSLSGYSIAFLDIAKSISFSITLISYVLYSISPEVIARIGSDKLYFTSLFVFLGIMRYIQITVVDKESGSPTDVLWRDRFLQITILLWGLTFLFILYGKNI
jgi:decaprenyl-phosphate phosphoribosyltransferase